MVIFGDGAPPGPVAERPDEVLALDNVSKVYPGLVPVAALQPTDLTIRRGDFVGVVGPSGSGKSTLLNILGLLDSPSSGEVRIDGQPTTTMSDAELAYLRGRSIGFVFQAFHLLDYRTALENAEMSLLYTGIRRRDRRKRAAAALSTVGLSHRQSSTPNHLSGGERQRLAIARALVAEPTYILCDEPTGNLDSKNTDVVMDLLTELSMEQRTVIVVTHDPRVAQRCQRQILVSDGVVSESPPRPAQ